MSNSSKNINSFAENMRRTITAQTNALSLLESIQTSMSSNDTFVTYDYTSLKNGEINTYLLPSYTAMNNRLQAVENSLQNITNGSATINLNDGSRRLIKVTNIPLAPDPISSVTAPSLFKLDTNWFFEDLMFPGIAVSVNLSGQIDDKADRVRVSRIIVDANVQVHQNFWNNSLVNNDYTYKSLKELLSYNGIAFSEDIQDIHLPLVRNSAQGIFLIIKDPEIIDDNTWYTFDTIAFSSVDENGVDLGTNNILSVGDKLVYNNSMFKVIGIDLNYNRVRLQILNGSAFPGVFSVFNYYEEPFKNKTIDIRVGAHEYDFIYIKSINEDFNIVSNSWSSPIKFATDDLTFTDDVNVTLKDYYNANVVDWGAQWIAQAKERKVTAYYGHTPNAPVLSTSDLRVVLINTLINAALENATIKATAADIESTKTLIKSLKNSIAAQQTEMQTITDLSKYNEAQGKLETDIKELSNQQARYSSLVHDFLTAVQDNKAVVEKPKYHIRGFFPIPLYRYRDDNNQFPEYIIGFDIAYRYICEDNTGTELNTFNYTDTDGQSIVTGTFTDWIIEQSKLKLRVWNVTDGMYYWEDENVGDGGQININQIDIPITKGEKVEIKVRSISEAGYPENPLKSAWSETITIAFPDNYDTENAMALLVKEINDDAMNIAINNTLDSIGVGTHLDDTIANTNSVSGLYYKHTAKNIAYEDKDETTGTISTFSLQDKIATLEERIKLLEEYIVKQTNTVGTVTNA